VNGLRYDGPHDVDPMFAVIQAAAELTRASEA